jgi:hypothetical protein
MRSMATVSATTSYTYFNNFHSIYHALELGEGDREVLQKTELFMSIAAMFHDIRKTIRRADHPQIGANPLRNFNQHQTNLLVKLCH